MIIKETTLWRSIEQALGDGFQCESGPSGTGLVYVYDMRGWLGMIGWGTKIAYYNAYRTPHQIVTSDADVASCLEFCIPHIEIILRDENV